MDTFIEREVRATADALFQLAGRVEDWPRILPHYRFVRVLGADDDGSRTVEMAARRDVLGRVGFPLHWTARQWLDVSTPRVAFEHIGGISRGMRVAWTFEPLPAGRTRVRITHLFAPRWPLPDQVITAVVGDYFVNGVARRTLATIAGLAEASSLD
jgi:ribosome-associated toxin RatA of RatAB toxin-antitoxin module